MNCLIKIASKRNEMFLITCRSKSIQYNALSKQNKQLIDQMLRVDHAGKVIIIMLIQVYSHRSHISWMLMMCSILVLNHESSYIRERESLRILGLNDGVPGKFHESNGTWAAFTKHILDTFQGEYGANRIYAGQMAVLGKSQVGTIIQVGIIVVVIIIVIILTYI
jgi:hypothetical protein